MRRRYESLTEVREDYVDRKRHVNIACFVVMVYGAITMIVPLFHRGGELNALYYIGGGLILGGFTSIVNPYLGLISYVLIIIKLVTANLQLPELSDPDDVRNFYGVMASLSYFALPLVCAYKALLPSFQKAEEKEVLRRHRRSRLREAGLL